MNDVSTFLDAVFASLTPEQVYEGHFSHQWNKTKTRWRGCCPWHDSKSGSAFYVRPNTLSWNCPSCEIGGNPIQYLHQMNGGVGSPRGIEFVKIAKQLGEMTGIDYPEKELTPAQQQQMERVEQRRSIIDCVHTASIAHLWSEDGAHARQYLTEERRLTEAQIKDLRLGLFPSPDVVLDIASKNGADLSKASDLGLLYKGRDEVFSPLTGYITLPWNDQHGRMMNLYGRWPAKTAPGKQPKTKSLKNPTDENGDGWLKTKASPLFLDRAIAAREDSVIVVEGLFDAAVLQANGDSRVIAWVAANPSSEQISTLKKQRINNVAFCLDPDGAGDKGTLAGIRRLTAEGIDTFVVPRLPDGQDPDEFVIGNGVDKWRERCKQSVHGLRYAAKAIARKHGEEPTDKQRSEILSAAKSFAEELNAPDKASMFFWPEFQKETGSSMTDAAPDYDEVLDQVEQLIADEPDESRLDWKLLNYSYDNNLKQRGFTGPYLKQQVQARLDGSATLEVIDTAEILEKSPKREWIVGGIIPANSVVLTAASGGIGKTTWAYQMARAIAVGQPWSGLPTQPGKVLIVQVDEPRADTAEKLWESRFEDVPTGSVKWIRRWRFTQCRQLFQIVRDLKPALVVIDSLTAAMAGTGVDMIASNAGDALYKLRDFAEGADWPCSFQVLHHMNKNGTTRDSSSFHDNVSEVQTITKSEGDSHLEKNQYVLSILKSRAGIQGEYILERDDTEYRWIYEGPKEAPTNFYTLITLLETHPLKKFSASQVANELNIRTEEAKATLELARKLCFIEGEMRPYINKETGDSGRFRLYWGRPKNVHPEVAEVLPPIPASADVPWGSV